MKMNEKKEYIERGALIDSFENCYYLYNSTDREIVRQALENAPAADVAPVVHGKWIPTTKHKWRTREDGEIDEFARDCAGEVSAMALDLINRLKAEIERLNHIRAELSKDNDRLKAEISYMKSPNTIGDTHEMGGMVMGIDLPRCNFKNCRYCFDSNCIKNTEYERCEYRIAKAEAIKEFAERLKNKSDYCYFGNIDSLVYRILEKDLAALVQEMTEGRSDADC